jgi:hypothetical protein
MSHIFICANDCYELMLFLRICCNVDISCDTLENKGPIHFKLNSAPLYICT